MTDLIAIAVAEGLIRPEYHGMSAKQLRAVNPALADKWAAHFTKYRAEYVKAIADRLSK